MSARRFRVEDDALLRGRGCFIADTVLDGQAFGVCVGSPRAHAQIVSVDRETARTAPGVLAILTGADPHEKVWAAGRVSSQDPVSVRAEGERGAR
jgi:CO/xanthine dehydrogenase Mo-binding subunit